MECLTLERYDESGKGVYKPKLKYKTLDDAIAAAKVANSKDKQLTKLVAYKCSVCFKYHIGRNGKTITDKVRNKNKQEVFKKQINHINLKVIGKIKVD